MRGLVSKPAIGGAILLHCWIFVFCPIHSALFAQEPSNACADAERQATQDFSASTWFAIGCLAGVTGWLVSIIIDSSAPASPLVGKSPEYVAAYSDCYRQKAKDIRSKNALTGCIVSTTVIVVTYSVLLIAAASTAEENSGW
jgi:hypothetical protein